MRCPIVTVEAQSWFGHRSGILAGPTEPVTEFGEELASLIRDMEDTLKAIEIGVGLAAPQIGSNQRVALIYHDRQSMVAMVNPKIVRVWGKKDSKRESCLSVPPWAANVERRTELLVEYQNLNGDPAELEASGFLSRVIQHELDHLDGKLYLDHITSARDLSEQDFFDDYDPTASD